jgi:hypothetical protein
LVCLHVAVILLQKQLPSSPSSQDPVVKYTLQQSLPNSTVSKDNQQERHLMLGLLFDPQWNYQSAIEHV